MGKRPTTEWGRRADAAGLDQITLAKLAGVSENSVSRGLRGAWASGVPGYLLSLIIAWELMSPDQRRDWISSIDER